MIALTLFFYTIHKLPIAISSTLQYLAPIFTLLFATVWLKEKIKWLQWICIVIALSGVFVIGIGKNTTENIHILHSLSNFKWIIIGVISAVFSLSVLGFIILTAFFYQTFKKTLLVTRFSR